jgi:hypothetical protein
MECGDSAESGGGFGVRRGLAGSWLSVSMGGWGWRDVESGGGDVGCFLQAVGRLNAGTACGIVCRGVATK